MSVLQVLGSSADGGAETFFVDLVEALDAAGVDQAVALRAHAGRQAQIAALGIKPRVLPFAPVDPISRPCIAAQARKVGAKAIIAWMSRAGAHTPRGPWARIGRLGGYYDPKYFKGFDMLVGNTVEITDWLAARGWPRDKTLYIPNFARVTEAQAVSRAELGTPDTAPLLLGMGRLHDDKAHDISLRAMPALPEAWLWIAGSGPREAELKALAASLGVADRVRFLGWRSDAAALYRTADICVFPSRVEPLGNVVLQAWAHGLPIVAGASKGPAALIREGEDGLVVPINDPEALAAAVRRLLGDPMLRVKLAHNGLGRIETEFSEAAVVAQWRDLLARYGAV